MTSTTSTTGSSEGDREPVLLDRLDERQALDDLVTAVTSGLGRAMVVHGEAGIGKTRLLESLSAGSGRPIRPTSDHPPAVFAPKDSWRHPAAREEPR